MHKVSVAVASFAGSTGGGYPPGWPVPDPGGPRGRPPPGTGRCRRRAVAVGQVTGTTVGDALGFVRLRTFRKRRRSRSVSLALVVGLTLVLVACPESRPRAEQSSTPPAPVTAQVAPTVTSTPAS